MTDATQQPDTFSELRGLMERATGEGERPLPWTVWTSCSYRRVKDANDRDVLSAYNQRADNHPDLSMPEDRLVALIKAVNLIPALLDERDRLIERVAELTAPEVLAAIDTAEAAVRRLDDKLTATEARALSAEGEVARLKEIIGRIDNVARPVSAPTLGLLSNLLDRVSTLARQALSQEIGK